jgi:NADPH:quinone reductase-like Zn-dependent oxidoreductase
MRAALIQRQGTPVASNIAFVKDWPDPPPPGPNQALIKTIASAFNHMDLWVGRGVGGLTLTYPRISGCDACGTVEAVGPGVDQAWLGKRVIVNAATRVAPRTHPDDPPASTLAPAYELIGEHSNGMFCEKFLAPAANLALVGDADPNEAAAFGLCALTAYSMMITKGQLRAGQTVLIPGIGGGVATSALALAKHYGCRVAVTSRHQWKLDRAKALGADLTILDNGDDWSKQVRAWTNKRGIDMAVDSVGKAAHLNCIKSLARGGTYLTPGATTGADATTDLARIFWNQLRILGSTMGSNEEFAEVATLFRTGKVRPVIDKVCPAEQAKDAYARLEAGEQFGKIVLTW